MFYVNLHCSYRCQCYICIMSTSFAIKRCVVKLYINFVLCQLPLQLLDVLFDNFVICQLPLQSRDRLISIISTLFHVNFHCTLYPYYFIFMLFYVNLHFSYWMHWWNLYWFCFMLASIAIIRCIDKIHVILFIVLYQLPLQLWVSMKFFILLFLYVNFHCN